MTRIHTYLVLNELKTIYQISLLISFYVLVIFLSEFTYSMCGRLSWPALWSIVWAHINILTD